MNFEEDEFILLSGIQHYIFCPRQWCLIHIEQQWAENYLTTVGNLFHERAHNNSIHELRGDTLTVRNLSLSSYELGIIGKSDIVEFKKNPKGSVTLKQYKGNWDIFPVEYKSGKAKDNNADRYQVVSQALCIEEMFNCKVQYGFLYYGKTHNREIIEIDMYRDSVIKCFSEMHKLLNRGACIKAFYSSKCKACSFMDVCMPKIKDKVNVAEYIENMYKDDVL